MAASLPFSCPTCLCPSPPVSKKSQEYPIYVLPCFGRALKEQWALIPLMNDVGTTFSAVPLLFTPRTLGAWLPKHCLVFILGSPVTLALTAKFCRTAAGASPGPSTHLTKPVMCVWSQQIVSTQGLPCPLLLLTWLCIVTPSVPPPHQGLGCDHWITRLTP